MDTAAPERSVLEQLEYLEFSQRVKELRAVGRIDDRTEQMLADMASESADLREFKARMNYGGPRLMNATEYRYLTSTLETPEGQRPASWQESEAYVRAFGIDRYAAVTGVQQQERERELEATRTYA